MSDSSMQCLTIQAGGRRNVLRALIPRIARDTTAPFLPLRDFWFNWARDQPMLQIRVHPMGGALGYGNAITGMVEHALDELMSRHPWDDQPLLDWPSLRGQRRLLVELDVSAIPAEPTFPLAEKDSLPLAHEINALLTEDGTDLKNTLIQAMCFAFNACPELPFDRESLLERIDVSMRSLVRDKTELLLQARALETPSANGLWPALKNALTPCGPESQALLLQSVVNRLAFRPDEEAYLILIAKSLSSKSRKNDGSAHH